MHSTRGTCFHAGLPPSLRRLPPSSPCPPPFHSPPCCPQRSPWNSQACSILPGQVPPSGKDTISGQQAVLGSGGTVASGMSCAPSFAAMPCPAQVASCCLEDQAQTLGLLAGGRPSLPSTQPPGVPSPHPQHTALSLPGRCPHLPVITLILPDAAELFPSLRSLVTSLRLRQRRLLPDSLHHVFSRIDP